jgi:hypothetical protein
VIGENRADVETGIMLVDPEPLPYWIAGMRLASPANTDPNTSPRFIYGAFEDFRDPQNFSTFAEGKQEVVPEGRESLLQILLRYFERQPPGLDPRNVTILPLAYYPLRIIAAEWMKYVHVMTSYMVHYEFSLKDDLHLRLLKEDIVDLQRWR